MISFTPMNEDHGKAIIDIFNYYVENTNAAFPLKPVDYQFFSKFIENARTLSGYAIEDDNKCIIGFCMLKPYNPNDTFNETVEVSYFLDHNYKSKGIGKLAFAKLLDDAKRLGKRQLIATISGDNGISIAFHKKLGFVECGRFHNIGMKFNKRFDLVFMQLAVG